MSALPLVSVVLPTYNRALLLHRAVRSVLAQTCRDLELLVVDDASMDDTRAVVAAMGDDRIRYLRHTENRGGSAARNTGLRVARGRYVAFLDSDDEWRPGLMRRQLAALRGAPDAVAAYAGFAARRAADGSVVTNTVAHPEQSTRAELLRRNSVSSSSTVMVRRDALQAAGGFDEALPSCQDWDLWIRLSEQGRFCYVPGVWAVIRLCERQESACPPTSDQITADADAVLRGHEMLLAKHRPAIEALDAGVAAQHHVRMGRHALAFGQVRRARLHFWQAMRQAPLDLEAFALLLITAPGPSAFYWMRAAWRTLKHLLM